jgi:hypothetical protein
MVFFFWALLIIAIQILSYLTNALRGNYSAGNAVYGFSVCRVLESRKAAKMLRFYSKIQLAKLVNNIMQRLFCHCAAQNIDVLSSK